MRRSLLGPGAALAAAASVMVAAGTPATVAAEAGGTGNATDHSYSRTTLPLLPKHSSGSVRAINDAGVAVGSQVRERTGVSMPVLWGPRGPRTLSLPRGAEGGSAADINNQGVVVGSAVRRADGRTYAVRWTKGRARWLTVPPRRADIARDHSSEAVAVNDAGVAVGSACVDRCLAASWSKDGTERTFNSPAGATAYDVNASNVAVGTYSAAGLDAFIWFLHKDPAPFGLRRHPDTVVSSANGINDAGTVVGTTAVQFEPPHAVMWVDGEPITLPDASVDAAGAPRSINNDGIIVGGSGFPTEAAVVWRNGAVLDLPTPQGAVAEAVDVNESAEIVGNVSGAPTLWRVTSPARGS